MASTPHPASLSKASTTIERLRHEIDECRAMLRHVEALLQKHRNRR